RPFTKRSDMKLRIVRSSFVSALPSFGAALASLLILNLPPMAGAADWGHATHSSPIAISITDRLIWVVNPSDDTVSVIRPDNNTVLTNIAVGDEPQSLALTPDNQYVYVANAAAGTVTVIKITTPAWGSFSAGVDTSAGIN